MPSYEYRVVAAPTKGVKAKGIKSAEARFSHAIEQLMNDMALDGWEYQRAETLPSIERSGLTSTTTQWRNVLVFRRARETAPDTAKQPIPVATAVSDESASASEEIPDIVSPQHPDDDASKSAGASRMLRDNGVEEVSDVSGLTNSLTQLAASRNSLTKPDS
jgi:hypothetical protein